MGALFLTLLYCGNGGATHPAFVLRAGSTPSLKHEVWEWLAQHARIYPTSLDAWYFQMQHNAKGHPWFLLGMSDTKGTVWYYFPIALIIKASLPPIVAGAGVLRMKPRAAGLDQRLRINFFGDELVASRPKRRASNAAVDSFGNHRHSGGVGENRGNG